MGWSAVGVVMSRKFETSGMVLDHFVSNSYLQQGQLKLHTKRSQHHLGLLLLQKFSEQFQKAAKITRFLAFHGKSKSRKCWYHCVGSHFLVAELAPLKHNSCVIQLLHYSIRIFKHPGLQASTVLNNAAQARRGEQGMYCQATKSSRIAECASDLRGLIPISVVQCKHRLGVSFSRSSQ